MSKKILIINGVLPSKIAAAKKNELTVPTKGFGDLELALMNHSDQVFCIDKNMQAYINRQHARSSTLKPLGSDFFDCHVIVLHNIPNKGMAKIKEQFVMPSQAMVQQMNSELTEQPA